MVTSLQTIFIIPAECEDEKDCSEVVQSAYQACKANSIQVKWVKDSVELSESDLKKTDLVVFEKFEGPQFLKLKNSKAVRIVGTNCLLTCIVNGQAIPNFSWPIYNLAMNGCIVTASHINKSVKEDMRSKIQMMAGQYYDSFYEANTHLVTDSVKSEKYVKAAMLGAKLMLPTWVDAVWEASKNGNIHCDDVQFEEHRCPPLYKLIISSTGFTSVDERAELKLLVKNNGGSYTGQLHTSTTDILICKSTANSIKFKAAKKCNRIKCVSYDWILDSIAKGYALKDTDYTVKRSTSTPTKPGESIDPNFSTMSAISALGSTMQKSVFQETINMTADTTDINLNNNPRKRKSSSLDEVNDIIDCIDMKAVKKAGAFLDGCCVYIAGFTPDQEEKMSRILTLGSATQYDVISDRITHIIIGDPTQSDVRTLQRQYVGPIVNIQWLCNCIKSEKVVDEDEYLVVLQQGNIAAKNCKSPISQKGLKLLRREISIDAGPSELENQNDTTLCGEPNNGNDAEDTDIMQQYVKPNLIGQEDDTLAQLLKGNAFDSNQIQAAMNITPKPQASSQVSKKGVVNAEDNSQSTNISISDTEYEHTEQLNIFDNLKFVLYQFDEEQTVQLQDHIAKYGGEVHCIESNNKKQIQSLNLSDVDFIVVSAFGDNTEEILNGAKKMIDIINKRTENQNKEPEIVTDYFVMHCLQNLELVPIEYYHRPISIKNESDEPLEGCVVTISSYVGTERLFLIQLIIKLGGISQEQLCRVQKVGILASTHLLNPEPTGKKYEAAIRWGLPVVTKEWLLACARTGTFELESKHLVGDSKAPIRKDVPKGKSLESQTTVTIDNNHLPLDPVHNVPNNEQVYESESPMKENRDGNIQLEPSSLNVPKGLNSSCPGTPSTSKYFPSLGRPEYTPLNRIISANNQDSPQCSSQVTPVNELMNRFKMSNMITTPCTPCTPPLPKRYGEVDTPDTPYGAFIRPNPSPKLRKACLQWINTLPDYKPRRNSTPLSELKRRLWDKILPKEESTGNEVDQPDFEGTSDDGGNNISLRQNENPKSHTDTPETPQNAVINSKLQQLQQMLSSSGGNKTSLRKRESMRPEEVDREVANELKGSQPCTVGWDYDECDNGGQQGTVEEREMIFMITSIENVERERLVKHIEELGASVSNLQLYDPTGTHLLAAKPQRTEKMLSCIAAGKWILHSSYIEKSIAAGHLLETEMFEYGNPKANKDIMVQFQADKKLNPEALHYWRMEIKKRGYGAFYDMRAIIVSPKRDPIVRIVEAGGGMVVNAEPPFHDNVFATHCLIDPKKVGDLTVYVPLAKQGIYCVSTTYVSDFLYRHVQDIRDAVLPELERFYQEEK